MLYIEIPYTLEYRAQTPVGEISYPENILWQDSV